MIMVAGNCRRIDLPHPGEPVPDRFTLPILERGAFDLGRRSGRPPGEGSRKGIAAIFTGALAAETAWRSLRGFTARDGVIHGCILYGSPGNPVVIMFYGLRLHPVVGKSTRGNWSAAEQQ